MVSDGQPIRGRGRPRKDGLPNAATVEKMRQLGHTDYQGNDIEWEEKALDAYLDGEDTDQQGYDDDDEQPIPGRFEPVHLPNPLKLLQTGAKKLSDMEVSTLRPFLLAAVRGYSDLADDTISRTNRAHTEISEANNNLIWSDLDETEIATLVDGLLIIGKRQAHVAFAIREIARTWTMVEAGIILFPRFLKTMRFYADNGGIALW